MMVGAGRAIPLHRRVPGSSALALVRRAPSSPPDIKPPLLADTDVKPLLLPPLHPPGYGALVPVKTEEPLSTPVPVAAQGPPAAAPLPPVLEVRRLCRRPLQPRRGRPRWAEWAADKPQVPAIKCNFPEMGIWRFFYASSACIYPELKQLEAVVSLKESDAWPAEPQDAYGLEKLATEELCKHYTMDFGIECRIGRFHNI